MANEAPFADELKWPDHLIPFDPLEPAIQADPFAHYAWMRENAPVLRTRNGDTVLWFVSRYDDVKTAFRDPKLFSSEVIDPDVLPFLILMDPPLHSRLRGTVARAFTPKAVTQFEPEVRALGEGFFRPFVAKGGGEVVGEFSVPMSMSSIGALLGIPTSRFGKLRAWSDDVANFFGRVARHARGTQTDAAGFQEFLAYLKSILEAKAEEDDGSIAANLAGLWKNGSLTEREAVHFCAFLFLAGHETTTILIANGFRLFAEKPELIARLSQDPADIPKFIEELSRYRAAPQRMSRVATADAELSGVAIPKSSEIRLLPGSANRDSARFPNGDEFDIDRDTGGHMAFGHGIHSCIGSWLAKLEVRIVFELIVAEISSIEIDPAHKIVPYTGGTLSNTGPDQMHIKIST